MNTIQRLELAENIAHLYGRWPEFSRIYSEYRNKHRVLDSTEKTLHDMNLWEDYCKVLVTRQQK